MGPNVKGPNTVEHVYVNSSTPSSSTTTRKQNPTHSAQSSFSSQSAPILSHTACTPLATPSSRRYVVRFTSVSVATIDGSNSETPWCSPSVTLICGGLGSYAASFVGRREEAEVDEDLASSSESYAEEEEGNEKDELEGEGAEEGEGRSERMFWTAMPAMFQPVWPALITPASATWW